MVLTWAKPWSRIIARRTRTAGSRWSACVVEADAAVAGAASRSLAALEDAEQ